MCLVFVICCSDDFVVWICLDLVGLYRPEILLVLGFGLILFCLDVVF